VTPSTQARERHQRVRGELAELRQRRGELQSALRAARDHGDQNAVAIAELKCDEIASQIEMTSELEMTLLRQMSGVSSYGGIETFLDNPAAIAQLEQLAHSQMPIGSITLGPAIGRDQLLAMIQSGQWRSGPRADNGSIDVPDAARRGAFQGVRPQPRPRLRILDLIGTAPMDGRSFEYVQELGPDDTAREVAEDAIKPEAQVQLEDAEATAETIAHWLKLPRAALADAAGLDQILRVRLTYGVMRRLEDQIVGGDGTGENLQGILASTGVGEIQFDAAEALTDLALDGIVATLLSDAEPDAVVVNPLDWAAMLKARTDGGTGQRLDSDGAFATPPDRLWGLPAIPSKAIPEGQALVGDYASGCTLFVREGVNVRVSDSDQDDFVRNRVTMLGEGRFALAIWQPSAFTVVKLAANGSGTRASRRHPAKAEAE